MTDQELALDSQETESPETPEEELSEDQKLMAELKEAIVVKRETIGALRLKLTVEVPRDTVDHRMGKQFAELKRDALIPGFRKGHAPLRLVEKRFGSDVGEQLKSQLLGSGYLAAVEKENLKPLGDPMFWVKTMEQRTGEDQKPRSVEVEKLVPFDQALDHLDLPKDGAWGFSCELELKPEFELPSLEKIPVQRPTVAIDDEDVEVELKRLQMRRGTFQPVEGGAVQADDMLYVDMKMTVGDDVIASEENFDIAARDIRIKGVSLVGLGDALVGKKTGQKAVFEAPVPDDHENIDLRGKTARFDFAIREVKRLELPPMDADFLSSLGFESEVQLRETVRAMLEAELDRTVKSRMFDQIGKHLLDHTTLEIPAGLSQRQADRAVSRRMMEMLQSGVPPTELSKMQDEMRAQARDQSIRDLKLYFILEKIAEAREVDVKEEEINGAIAQIARRTGKRFDRVRDELSKGDGLSTLYWQIRDEKVLAGLLDDAEITEIEGPKKKSASKSEPRDPPLTPGVKGSARAEPKPSEPRPASKPEPKPDSRVARSPGGTGAAPTPPKQESGAHPKGPRKKTEPRTEKKSTGQRETKPAAKSAARNKNTKRGG